MTDTLHPCVRPRRRFVLAFVGVCMLWVLVAFCCYGVGSAEFALLFLLGAGMLLIPSRTSYGTLMQLVGLAIPLSGAVAAGIMVMELLYPSAEKVPCTQMAIFPFMVVWFAGPVFYPLGFALVVLFERRRVAERQKMQK
ncbi:MAG: hypothetical protein IKY92_00140 [Akkermansia sp.]|nr:hypothetical protein [Akkermansia sp.]